MRSLLCGTLFLALLHLGSALYFHIAETERKCFIEEVPDETLVVGMFCELVLVDGTSSQGR